MKWLHNILKGISLTGALFVFQACYGSPQDPMWDMQDAEMSFSVVSHVTGEPLEGIQVSQDNRALGKTGADGKCKVQFSYRTNYRGPYLRFEDGNELYAVKDTVLDDLTYREIIIKMDPKQ